MVHGSNPRGNVMRKVILGLLAALFSTAALAQPVQQSGTATQGHAAAFVANGVIRDAGTAANGNLTSIGVTASGSGICQNSAATSSAGWQQICMGATTAGGGYFSVQNFGTASAQGFTILINGTPFVFPTGLSGTMVTTTVPTVTNDVTCWNNTAGALKSCNNGLPTNIGLGSMAAQNANSVAITGGAITGMPTPTLASDVATKSYADGIAAGIIVLSPSRLATATILPNTPTYANGASGVGATLTAGSNGALSIDGTLTVVNDKVLIKNQASTTGCTVANAGCQNGIYNVTTVGDGSNPYVLTRATYFDTSAEMLIGSYTLITAGSTNVGAAFTLAATVTTVGTTPATFNQFSTTSGTVTGGGGGIVPSSGSTTLYSEQMPTGGRVTLISGSCVATTDQVAATVVYYAPCGGGEWLPVYDGTDMKLRQFTGSTTDQIGLTLTLGSNWAANTNYDMFVTVQASVVTACSLAWTNSGAGTSSRSTAVTLFKGVWVNNAAISCRDTNLSTFTCAQYQCTLVGGFRTNNNTGQVDLKFGTAASGGGAACICIWNVYNIQNAAASVSDTTVTWNYTTATYRQANGSTGNQINVLQGLPGAAITVNVAAFGANTGTNTPMVAGIGIDATAADSSTIRIPSITPVAANNLPISAYYGGNLAVGYHNINRLEYSAASGTSTWIGVIGANQIQTGVHAVIPY
jgi:hypothetical protein